MLQGTQLMQLEEWLKSHPGFTNSQERDFLQASHRLIEEKHSLDEPQLRSEIENSRKVLDTEHQRAESYRMQAEAEHHGSKHHDGGDFHDLLLLLAAPGWGNSACVSDAAAGGKVAGVVSAAR